MVAQPRRQRNRPDGVAQTSGAGSVAQLPPGTAVEVKGTLRVRVPLAAEFSQRPAAWFKSEIVREETYYERDLQGRDQRRTRTTTVYQNMNYGQCLVEDQTGRVGIDFDGAEVEAVRGGQRADRDPSGGAAAWSAAS